MVLDSGIIVGILNFENDKNGRKRNLYEKLNNLSWTM